MTKTKTYGGKSRGGQLPRKKKCLQSMFYHIDARSPLSTEDLGRIGLLKSLLQGKPGVVAVSGAGISVNAGIPDFQTLRKTGQSLFDISAYNSSTTMECLHALIRHISELSEQARPTILHEFLHQLALKDRLLRHYTQNIDCMEHQRLELWQKTVQLHGRIDQSRCQSCGWIVPLTKPLSNESGLPDCPRCLEVSRERERKGRRSLSTGRLRPNIVLYGEENPDSDLIGDIVQQDLRKGAGIVLVIGTSLKVPGARRLVKELCRATRSRGGQAVWINRDNPPSALRFDFNAVIRGDCDDIASILLE